MSQAAAIFLSQQLELAEQLRKGRLTMLEPQDLPGRYGRVVRAVDHLIQVINCVAVIVGGWAVWRHGYVGRVTQDLDIVLPADRIEDFMRAAAVAGFEVLPVQPGRWPKLLHKDTAVEVDILPEGARPGTTAQPAPTLIPHPAVLGGQGTVLHYVNLPGLIELKLGAGRARDESDIVELIRTNPGEVIAIRTHLAGVHATYVTAFDRLVERARQQEE